MSSGHAEICIDCLQDAPSQSAHAVACEPRVDLIVHLEGPRAVQRGDVGLTGCLDALPLRKPSEMG